MDKWTMKLKMEWQIDSGWKKEAISEREDYVSDRRKLCLRRKVGGHVTEKLWTAE
jgi:hypothetical protein